MDQSVKIIMKMEVVQSGGQIVVMVLGEGKVATLGRMRVIEKMEARLVVRMVGRVAFCLEL